MATLESFWPKKQFDERSLFGSNVFKRPARYKVRKVEGNYILYRTIATSNP